MKRLLAALLAVSLVLPATVSAFTPAEEGVFRALCRLYPNSPPPGVDMDPAQWRSFCVMFR